MPSFPQTGWNSVGHVGHSQVAVSPFSAQIAPKWQTCGQRRKKQLYIYMYVCIQASTRACYCGGKRKLFSTPWPPPPYPAMPTTTAKSSLKETKSAPLLITKKKKKTLYFPINFGLSALLLPINSNVFFVAPMLQ